MTEVLFYFNAPDRIGTACKLLRKVVRSGAAAAVCGPADRLDQLDRSLWTFDPLDFLPHARVPAGTAVTPALRRTPIWLVDDLAAPLPQPVLLHLGDTPCAGFASFERLIEVVSAADDDRAAARARWKHYKARGYAIINHELAA